jgi:SAM-dependent methyltransferase
MTATGGSPDDQKTLWNGPAGRAWVEEQALLDRLFQPIEALLVEAVAARRPRALLDVGCGTGAVTLAAARRLGEHHTVHGVDISEPMIAAARARAERERLRATFVCADVQAHAFDPGSVDMIVSRFGVMFFGDPVAAFANLRRAARPGAGLMAVAWRSAAENPFMTTAERAAAPLLPGLPPRRPDGPGQFAFAEAAHVRRILAASGWSAGDVQPIDVPCALPEPDLGTYVARLGPVGLMLQQVDEHTRRGVLRACRAAFEPFVAEGEVRFTAACWAICATA